MSDEIFAASHAKLKRAERFIDELEAERLRYLADDPATAVLNTATMQIEIEVKGVGLEPGAIIGDAIHNLRTALDQMASEMARINNRSDKDVYFPFADTLESLESSSRFKEFKKCGQDCVDKLLELKPYRGGNDALRAIHDLDIYDKHRSLIPAVQTFDCEVRGSFMIDDPSTHRARAMVKNLAYIFPPGTPLDGQEIIPTLKKLVETFRGILVAFAGLIAARK